MENYKVDVGESAGSYSLGRLWKRWIDTIMYCLRKEVWMSGKQGEWYIIGVNDGNL